MKLYHYVHCPFCVRVRLALGFFKLDFESIVLPYNDEQTPLALTGLKLLPIMEIAGETVHESLDIIKKLDPDNLLKTHIRKDQDLVEDFLSRLATPIHNLCMPYWIYTPEFDEDSRKYFTAKKTKKRGPFKKIIQNKKSHLKELVPVLMDLQLNLAPFFRSEVLTINDIMLASHLWGMYIFPEFQFPAGIHEYLQRVKNRCQFDYHKDFWE